MEEILRRESLDTEIEADKEQFHDPKVINWSHLLPWVKFTLPISFQERHDALLRLTQKRRKLASDGSGPRVGEWLLTNPVFVEWMDGDLEAGEGRTLCLSGGAASGKSVLSSLAISHITHHHPTHYSDDTGSTATAYLYCNRQTPAIHSPLNITSSLLFQLVYYLRRDWDRWGDSNISKKETCMCRRRNGGKFDWDKFHREMVPEIMEDVRVTLLSYNRVFIVLDGVEELEEEARETVMGMLRGLVESVKAVRLWVTERRGGREGGVVERWFKGCGRIEITRETVGGDVRVLVKDWIDAGEFPAAAVLREDERLRQQVVETITEKTGDVFALATHYIKSLEPLSSPQELQQALQILPATLTDVYDNMITAIFAQPKADLDLARSTLIWLLTSLKPLFVTELTHALAVPVTGAKITSASDLKIPSIKDILRVTHGLVSIDSETSLVLFSHGTVAEYFHSHPPPDFLDDAHAELALACLTYLTSPIFGPHPTEYKALDEKLRMCPFFKYSATHWGDHVRLAGDGFEDKYQELISEFLIGHAQPATDGIEEGGEEQEKNSNLAAIARVFSYRWMPRVCGNAQRHYDQLQERTRRSANPLIVATSFGLVRTMQYCLTKLRIDVNVPGSMGRRPFVYALKHRHFHAAEYLLRNCPELDPALQCEYRKSLVQYTAGTKGAEGVLELLVGKQGAFVDERDPLGMSPLAVAAQNGCVETVRLLLGKNDPTPQATGTSGSRSDNEADIDDGDGGGDAEEEGGDEEEEVEEDEEQQERTWIVNPNSRCNADTTPLILAAANGQLAVVELLLSRPEVDPTLECSEQKGALLWAAAGGHLPVVKALLNDPRIDPARTDNRRRTSLYWASRHGSPELIQLLLERGVDPNQGNDKDFRAPLARAAQWGNLPVVRLLAANAFVTTEFDTDKTHFPGDYDGKGALYWAVLHASREAVDILLRKGFNPNTLDAHREESALGTAIRKNRVGTMKQLLECPGIDIHIQDGSKRFPLLAAIGAGNENAFNTLVDREWKSYTQDEFTRMLHEAIVGSNESILSVLLGEKFKGYHCNYNPFTADPSVAEDSSPLPMACFYGLESVVKMLLERPDTDVNFKGGSSLQTPLFDAVRSGIQPIVDLLLSHGADINARDKFEETPLTYAAQCNKHEVVLRLLDIPEIDVTEGGKHKRTLLFWAVLNDWPDIAERLLANPHVCPNSLRSEPEHGPTPFSEACDKGRDEIVRMLISRPKVNINAKSTVHGLTLTPLSRAVAHHYIPIVNLLLSRPDIDTEMKHPSTKSPLAVAAELGYLDIVKLLVDRPDADVNSRSGREKTALMLASFNGRTELVEYLLSRPDVHLNLTDGKHGRNALAWAAIGGHVEIFNALLSRPEIAVDQKARKGQTPLSYAAMLGHVAIVRTLVRREDVDVDSTDVQGKTPLMWAVERAQAGVVMVLARTGRVDPGRRCKIGKRAVEYAESRRNGARRTGVALKMFRP